MKTIARTLVLGGILAVAFSAKPAQAQVSVGIATPGFALGVGTGGGYVAGGYYPGYPVVVPPPVVYGPRPGFYAPPVYARPYYGGFYGRGYAPAPRYAGPHYYRR